MKFWIGVGIIALVAGTAPRDARAQLPGDSLRAEQLRQMIEDRFSERLAVELRLTPDEASRVRVVLAGWGVKRRELEREDRQLRRQLNAEMRPGVAANEATVNRLVDGILSSRLAYVQTFKDEIKDLTAVLSPIQRAQYLLLRDRLLQRIQEVREQRAEENAPARRRRLRP
jgi:hypothetical protein